MSDRREQSFPSMPFDSKSNTVTLTLWNDEGDETEVSLPAKFEVCGTCQGRGSHVNPSIDSQGITQEEFNQDPDFEEAYFAGAYDVTCNECGGLRVTPVVDVDSLKGEALASFEAWTKQEDARAREDRADAYTRRMECGGYD